MAEHSMDIHITQGPSCKDRKVLKELLDTGVSAVRLNLSHIKESDLAESINLIRETSPSIKIGTDIRGRKLRTGPFPDGKIILQRGADFRLIPSEQEFLGSYDRASVNYPDMSSSIKEGTTILLDDGALVLEVKETLQSEVVCVVEKGGELPERSGVNIPGHSTNIPPLTEKDYEDINSFPENVIDHVYLSYVETAQDIRFLRNTLKELYREIPIIAKVELLSAVNHIGEIVAESDGICIARGDLGTEIPLPELPYAQRHIVAEAKGQKKPLLLAGELLFSLVHRHTPYRAELTDIVTAVEQGVNGFILSDETAVGVDPVNAVRTINALINEALSRMKGNNSKHIR